MSGAFSHSRLTLLDDCPRRYAYRYVEKVPEGFRTADAFMGTMVHEALQWLYMEREARREPTEDEVVARYRDTWAQHVGPDVRVVQDDGSLEAFRDDGASMLARHYRDVFRADRLQTLAVEPQVRLELGGVAPPSGAPATERDDEAVAPSRATYIGYIDRLARDREGTMHVIDYKTGRRIPRDIGEAGLQVRGYGVGVLETHGGVEVVLRYEYLRHGRHLSETFPRARSSEVAGALAERVRRALAAERAGDFPPRPSGLCRWCGHREICEASPFRAAPLPAASAAVAPSDAQCPLCGADLRLRVSTRSELVACERYPDCPHARDATPGDHGRFPAPGRRTRP